MTAHGIAGFLRSSRNRGWLLGLMLVGGILIAFQPVWHAGFVWDDDEFLLKNSLIQRPDGLYYFWCTTAAPDYFPLTSTTLWLEWRLWGTNPLGYHVGNVLLHALSAVLVWRVLARLKISGAWLAAAVFAVHPVNVESVAWITERKNTLAMVCQLTSLLCYLKFEDTGRKGWYVLSFGTFVLGLLSKTAVVPLPLVLVGLAWWRRGRVDRQDILRTLPFFGAAVLLGLITIWFQSHRSIGSEMVRTDSLWSRLAAAGWAVWFYLYKALLPVNLIFVYPRWRIDAANVLSYVPGLLVVAGAVVFWRQRKRWGKACLFALGYFVVMLLPVLGFINIYFMKYSLVADHWQYFAIIGPIALGATGISMRLGGLEKKKPFLNLALRGSLVVALGVLTWRQCGMYANIETLWRTTLARNPDSSLAHYNLGIVQLGNGQADQAIASFERAVELQPDAVDALINLGVALAGNGKVDQAIVEFKKVLEFQPDRPDTHTSLGNALSLKGQLDEAIRHYQKALKTRPEDPVIHNNLGNVLLAKGQVDEAIRHYQKALEARPEDAMMHNNLGNVFLAKGQWDEAISHYQTALKTRPEDAMIHKSLGEVLLQIGRPDEAIAHFRKALEIQPNNATIHYNLGNLLLQNGRTDDAIVHFQKALEIQPDNAWTHGNLGNILLEKGQVDEAIVHYQKALQVQPDSANTHNNLAAGLLRKGRVREAITHYQTAVKLQPDDVNTLSSLAWVLATFPEATLRNGAQAIELAQHANQLSGGNDPTILSTLAAAEAEAGRYPEAVTTVQRAIQLAAAQTNTALVNTLQMHLGSYQSGSPLRDAGQAIAPPSRGRP